MRKISLIAGTTGQDVANLVNYKLVSSSMVGISGDAQIFATSILNALGLIESSPNDEVKPAFAMGCVEVTK